MTCQETKIIAITKQYKGREVVVLDRRKYFDKCLAMLNTEQFLQLQKDLTISLKRKVQRSLRKVKQKFMLSSTQQDRPRESFMVQPRYINYQ